jgi:NIMA (never in mitosis gene a)-related kinase
MEYVGGGDLLQKIPHHVQKHTRFNEDTIWSYAIQILKGLKTLDHLRILHRDLKSANIFISRDGKFAKIGDLNVAVIAKHGTVHTQTGTPYYASPEVWRDDPYNSKSDIWSLGCVLYEMATGRPPFLADDMQGLFKIVQRGVFDPLPACYSADLTALITSCLTTAAKKRPSCENLLNESYLISRIDLDPALAVDSTPLEINNALLQTLKFPKNMRHLAQILPNPRFNALIPSRMAEEIPRHHQLRR